MHTNAPGSQDKWAMCWGERWDGASIGSGRHGLSEHECMQLWVPTEVDISEGAGANLLSQLILSSYSKLHVGKLPRCDYREPTRWEVCTCGLIINNVVNYNMTNMRVQTISVTRGNLASRLGHLVRRASY